MRSIFRTVGRSTVRDALMISLSITLVGISYGALATHAGLQPWQVLLLATTVLGAASELLFVNTIEAGGAVALAVMAGLLVNSRNLAYSIGAGKFLAPGWRTWAGAHLINDESVAMALSRDTVERQRATFWVSGLLVLLAWPAGSAIGIWLGAVVSPAALGLDAVFPALLLCLVAKPLKDRTTLLAAVLGAVVAVALTPWVPSGLAPQLALFGLAAVFAGSKARAAVPA